MPSTGIVLDEKKNRIGWWREWKWRERSGSEREYEEPTILSNLSNSVFIEPASDFLHE